MWSTRDEMVLQEVAARAQQRLVVADIVKSIRAELFTEQLNLLDDPAKEKAALCTRRAGKTSLWSRAAVITALERPRCIVRIWAISRLRCKELIWDELIYLLARHGIEHTPQGTELKIKFPNGSEIRLVGADKDKETQKKRGDKTAMEVVIESQLFGSHLKTLVEDVVGPCLADLNGTFYLEGTPGPVCAGHWFQITGGNDLASRWASITIPGWSCHRWSVLNNPHLPHMREWLKNHKAKRRWADDNPTYLREWLARWVNDYDALFYAFDPLRNTFVPSPSGVEPWGPRWMHTLGWDLGFRDDMALTVWGFSPEFPNLYEAFSWKKPGASADEVIDEIVKLEQRKFNLVKMFADTGGGGKMYVEEVQKRYPYSFEPAQKQHKYDHVRLLNDDLRGGFALLQAGSPYALEMAELPKDPDWPDPDKPEKPPTEDPRFPNHCCDAGLYAYRGAMHYLHRDAPEVILPATPAWYAREEARMLKVITDRRAKDHGTWLDRYDDGPSPMWEDE